MVSLPKDVSFSDASSRRAIQSLARASRKPEERTRRGDACLATHWTDFHLHRLSQARPGKRPYQHHRSFTGEYSNRVGGKRRRRHLALGGRRLDFCPGVRQSSGPGGRLHRVRFQQSKHCLRRHGRSLWLRGDRSFEIHGRRTNLESNQQRHSAGPRTDYQRARRSFQSQSRLRGPVGSTGEWNIFCRRILRVERRRCELDADAGGLAERSGLQSDKFSNVVPRHAVGESRQRPASGTVSINGRWTNLDVARSDALRLRWNSKHSRSGFSGRPANDFHLGRRDDQRRFRCPSRRQSRRREDLDQQRVRRRRHRTIRL